MVEYLLQRSLSHRVLGQQAFCLHCFQYAEGSPEPDALVSQAIAVGGGAGSLEQLAQILECCGRFLYLTPQTHPHLVKLLDIVSGITSMLLLMGVVACLLAF